MAKEEKSSVGSLVGQNPGTNNSDPCMNLFLFHGLFTVRSFLGFMPRIEMSRQLWPKNGLSRNEYHCWESRGIKVRNIIHYTASLILCEEFLQSHTQMHLYTGPKLPLEPDKCFCSKKIKKIRKIKYRPVSRWPWTLASESSGMFINMHLLP